MSPVERERQKIGETWRELRSTKEITEEQQFYIQASSVAPMHDGAVPQGQSLLFGYTHKAGPNLRHWCSLYSAQQPQ